MHGDDGLSRLFHAWWASEPEGDLSREDNKSLRSSPLHRQVWPWLTNDLCPRQPGWSNNGFLIQPQKPQISPFACPPESHDHLSFREKKSYLQTDLTSSSHLPYLISLRRAGSVTVVTTHLSKSSFSEVLEALGSNSSSITGKPRHPNLDPSLLM